MEQINGPIVFHISASLEQGRKRDIVQDSKSRVTEGRERRESGRREKMLHKVWFSFPNIFCHFFSCYLWCLYSFLFISLQIWPCINNRAFLPPLYLSLSPLPTFLFHPEHPLSLSVSLSTAFLMYPHTSLLFFFSQKNFRSVIYYLQEKTVIRVSLLSWATSLIT